MESGKVVYRYSYRNGKLFVHEGTVTWDMGRPLVYFNDGSETQRCPADSQFGKVRRVGHSLWMTERNDDLARSMYAEYELNKIEKLKVEIDRRYRNVDILREGMSEV